MSQTQQQPEAYRCSGPDCSAEFQTGSGIHGSYCSLECSLRDDGRALLNDIEQNHCWCNSCFRPLKEVERPGDEYSVVVGPTDHGPADPTCRDVLVGYEYLTKHAQYGEREGRGIVEDDQYQPDGEGAPADSLVLMGVVCECGATDHRDDYLRRERVNSTRDAAIRICRALKHLGEQGRHDKTIDARVLARTLRESAETTGEYDWPLAVGRAIQD